MIKFTTMTPDDLKHWHAWVTVPHVKNTWFVQGYEPPEYIERKIAGNGYDHPFIIHLDNIPVGYIQCCDLTAYTQLCHDKKGVFQNEPFGTFCFDLFIADTNYLNKGYGTQIVKQFCDLIFKTFYAKHIIVDPSAKHQQAIRCYEKAGFSKIDVRNDGVMDCQIMQLKPAQPSYPALLTDFLEQVARWAYTQAKISSIALVGSHARGEATPQSDVDLVLLCDDYQHFLTDTAWIAKFGKPTKSQQEEYGAVSSLRVFYEKGFEVEYGFTSPAWANMPIDPGTKQVIAHGAKVVVDKTCSLTKLMIISSYSIN